MENITEAPELGTPHKMLVPNGVRYRGFPCKGYIVMVMVN